MKIDVCAALSDPSEYYDARHEAGWMDYWPEYKTRRVIGLIRSADIAADARVLEYGCGTGVFAAAVKRAEPSFEVCGCDISSVAIAKARQRCPEANFYRTDDPALKSLEANVDLVYTHHVLEHAPDLSSLLSHIARLLKPGGRALHVTPCANPGSMEHRISSLAGAGLDGRFCSDDSSHLRRLTARELADLSECFGLRLRRAWFANQFWGGLDYLTNEYYKTLISWVNPMQGAGLRAKLRLLGWMLVLLPLHAARKGPAHVLAHAFKQLPAWKRAVFLALLPAAIAAWPLAAALDWLLETAREREWRTSNRAPNGSEMYCLFEKTTVR